MGTRFVASNEWGGRRFKQEAVVAATTDDTVNTSIYDTILDEPFPAYISHRVLRNQYVERWQGHDQEIVERRSEFQGELAAADDRGDTGTSGISAGLAAGLVKSTVPAGDIVRNIVEEAELLLRNRPTQLIV